MKKMLWMAIAALMSTNCLYAQEITKIGRSTLTLNAASEDETGFYDQGANSAFEVCWFSFNYPSTGGDGQPVTLSALACMPAGVNEGAVINNVITGCHITITSNKECPTEMNTTNNLFSDLFLTMILASSNTDPQEDLAHHNLVILPDYEGYGITKDKAHPYLCEEVTAKQVTDALRYGIQLYQNDPKVESVRRPFREGWRTVCTGYSQGGAVAMATQRYIEEQGLSDELHLAGSLCGDGPYSPLATVLYYLEQDRQGIEMAMPVVLPLILKGLCDYDEALANYKVSDFLEERFLETGVLDWITDKEKKTDEITDAWKQLYANGKDGDETYFRSVLTSDGTAMLRNILKPELVDYLGALLDQYPDYAKADIPLPEPGSLAKDLHLALEHNNLTTGWVPSHPVCLFHSTGDEVVPFENYEAAANKLGEQVTFYPSTYNGTHVSTGMEFFLSSERLDCFRTLTSGNESGILATTRPEAASQKWYDLSGRLITGKPTVKGIYINGGKKMIVD